MKIDQIQFEPKDEKYIQIISDEIKQKFMILIENPNLHFESRKLIKLVSNLHEISPFVEEL